MDTLRHNFIATTAILFLMVFAEHLTEVVSSFIFELDLVSFENDGGRDYVGGCCGGQSESRCQGACPVYLRVCLKHYEADVDAGPRTFHEFSTPVLNDTSQLSQRHNISFDLKFPWPGQFTLIVEAWHVKEGGSKVLVTRIIAPRALQIGADWTQDRLHRQHTYLKVLYRVFCAKNYYGPKCENLCQSRNDKFGHYTCRADGEKLCIPGWTGRYCDSAVCLSGCHKNYGTCDQPKECKCQPGWEGLFCNSCKRYPGCMRGYCDQPWQCNCIEGWGGFLCDQRIGAENGTTSVASRVSRQSGNMSSTTESHEKPSEKANNSNSYNDELLNCLTPSEEKKVERSPEYHYLMSLVSRMASLSSNKQAILRVGIEKLFLEAENI